jgi:hypothetical protein
MKANAGLKKAAGNWSLAAGFQKKLLASGLWQLA